MKPLIGITMDLEIRSKRNLNYSDQDYAQAVQQAGGIPLLIAGIHDSIPDLVKRLDGFVFSGGDDMHPRFYREKLRAAAHLILSPDERARFEISLFKAAYKAKKPILAICGGEQLVNVALGGNLYQDIALQVPHARAHRPSEPGTTMEHEVAPIEGTTLYKILGPEKIRVRSSHHQSVKQLGKKLRCSARSSDQIIEAIETETQNFLIAVQWHPEKKLHDRSTKKLFKALVNASK
ncbi:MAG: gamma-glutamyl-gamma-aminobutyrate hydrolase family protein [Nitrospirota bacterium]